MLLNNARKNRFNKEALLLSILPAFAVLFAMLGVSFWVWATAKQDITRDETNLTNQHVDAIQDILENRLKSYEDVLRGTAALLETSKTITSDDLHAIIATYDVQSRFPGVRAIGYAPFIPKASLAQYSALMRIEAGPSYQVRPASSEAYHVPIQYIEPETDTNKAGVGLDFYSDAIRRAALDLAAQKGEAVITGKIKPFNNNPSAVGPAFQMYFPVYASSCTGQAQKRTDCGLAGFVFASFRADELVKATISASPGIKDNFTIFDGPELNEDSTMFESKDYDKNQSGSVATLDVYGRTWTLAVQVPQPILPQQLRNKPNFILTAGIILSVSSSAFIYILLLQRVRSLQQAKDTEVQMVKDDLLALAAHQLRTPATAVKQYLMMATEGYGGDLSKDQKKLIDKAYDNNERQLRTVNEMLYVANADAGKLRLIPRSVDLVQLVREAVEEQRSIANEKRHRMSVQLPSTPLYYDADELYLRMAISNLVSNAIKYTPDAGKVEVKLKITQRNIHIAVSDNGVGISKKQMPDLFKKFSRLDNPLSVHAMGNGLGLFLARRVVELHKGRIKVTSEHTVGSVFTIILPRPKSAGQDDPSGSKVKKEE